MAWKKYRVVVEVETEDWIDEVEHSIEFDDDNPEDAYEKFEIAGRDLVKLFKTNAGKQ